MFPSKEEIETQLADMSLEEIDKLVFNIHHIAKFLGNAAIKNVLVRKIAQLDAALTVQERKYRLGDYETGIKKSIQGQDTDENTTTLWPSLRPK